MDGDTAAADADPDDVRVLVLGDEHVGKTSLIRTFVSHEFCSRVPAQLPPVFLPAEATQVDVTTVVLDMPPTSEWNFETSDDGHVVVLCYDASRPETFHRLRSFWLPALHGLRHAKRTRPVVVVATKSDLRSPSNNRQHATSLEALEQDFPCVEAHLECSAKANLNIQKVFYFAQKAAVYPIAPLFDRVTMTMRPAFVKALTRVFRVFDLDRDELLNSQELNAFQTTCFGIRFDEHSDEMEKLYAVLEDVASGYVPNKGITVTGFMYLHELFIKKHRPENCWTVLHSLGYTRRLELIVPDAAMEVPKVDADQSFYFKSHGLNYLSDVFDQYDRDHDGHLSRDDLNEIFSTFPIPTVPWGESDAPQSRSGKHHLSKSGWMGLWSRDLMMEPKTVLRHLFYLGYVESPTTAIECTKPRKYLRQRSYVSLKTIHCLVLGSSQCGKSSLLDCLVMRAFSKTYHVTKKSRSVVNHVYGTLQDRSEKCLIMTEPSQEQVKRGDVSFDTADVLLLVFDPRSPESLSYIQDVQSRILPDNVPCVMVASKADLLKNSNNASPVWLRALNYCASLELEPPVRVSAKTGENVSNPSSWVFSRIIDAAQFTAKSCPMTESKREALQQRRRWKYMTLGCVSLALVMAVVAYGVASHKSLDRSRKKS